MNKDPFEKYLKCKEPSKREKLYVWRTAIGLQDVDGIKPSTYLIETASKNIEGDISFEDVEQLIQSYYQECPNNESRTEEADIVSTRIAKLISEPAFSFTPNQYLSIHKYLFEGIYNHAGKIRTYNITKKEWILNGKTVTYGNATNLYDTLIYDLDKEKAFSYKNLSSDEIIKHLARFIANLWQIHVFEEGNTRTTATFFIKYLKTLGFDVTNDIFAEHSWYFRNALVRANYSDLRAEIYETTIYLERFLENLLFEKKNALKNRALHIKQDIAGQKQDIENSKQDIESSKQDIVMMASFTAKTRHHITILREKYTDSIFGRTEVIETLKITASPASELIKKMLKFDIIEPVKGRGKGKYKFIH